MERREVRVVSVKERVDQIARKQVKLMQRTKDKTERDYHLMMWAGFLTGLRLTNAITQEEYNHYYEELRKLSVKLNAA